MIDSIGICMKLHDKSLNYVQMSFSCSIKDWCLGVRIAMIDITTKLYKQLCQVNFAVTACIIQGSLV